MTARDMGRLAIEVGPTAPPVGSWEDDEPGQPCSLCNGDGWLEDPKGREHDCPVCDSTGVAPGPCSSCNGAGGWQQPDGLIVECPRGCMTGERAA